MASTTKNTDVNEQGDGYELFDKKKPKLDKKFRHNWRIDMLSIPKHNRDELIMFNMSKKEKVEYVEKEKEKISKRIEKTKVKVPIEHDEERQQRMYDLTLQPIRYYDNQKKLYTETLGTQFEKKMNYRIVESNKTIYNEYKRARERIAAEKLQRLMRSRSRSTKSKSSIPIKKTQSERLKEVYDWCELNAEPKRIFKPPKIDRGPAGDLEMLSYRLAELAVPKRKYIRPSQESMNIYRRIKVSPNAMRYKISDRVFVLSRPLERMTQKPPAYIPGGVTVDALNAKASPRTLELAVPKPKATATDSDYNENAFKVSRAALRYVPTPRILELAKPLERE